ncbi:nuclear inhibitor of protein phosphatase 1 [Brevipalpus obovatus]|uniref:nuclear inhibitor of protein phosphatase 1 n=1 Tax=Brevipalpus obovatus TaxID=246614 RepID=UPI003D9F7EC5
MSESDPSHYKVPNWAGKPPSGYHLDVTKDGKLIQKLMIDDKKCYHFGRNPELNDVCIDHSSCSRVHAALVYHKALNRSFLVDLASTHGTFIGGVRLDAHKPTQLAVNVTFHFGASTRYYTLREKPNASGSDNQSGSENVEIGPHNLPESEMELDNLTEFNTVLNKRVSLLGVRENDNRVTKPRSILVRFKEEEDVINPEDVDPSVGRFRNLMQTTVIPKKRMKLSHGQDDGSFHILKPQIDSSTHFSSSPSSIFSTSMSIKLGVPLPNPVPDVDLTQEPLESKDCVMESQPSGSGLLQKKKKYAKEAWPGRRPTLL